MTVVTSDVILRGAWFALEQAGRLLVAADSVRRTGDETTAAGLALLAREEFAKARLLIDVSQEALSAGGVPASRLVFGDHGVKQRAGNVSAAIRTQNPRLVALAREDPEAFRVEMQMAMRAKSKWNLDHRAQLRERCLYVDYDKDRAVWLLPRESSPEEVGSELRQAITDYDNFVRSVSVLIDNPELRTEVGGRPAILAGFAAHWIGRPPLPRPPLPE